MAAGEDWEDVAEERLFRPLGMASTSSRHADFLTRTNRAALHIKPDGAAGRRRSRATRTPRRRPAASARGAGPRRVDAARARRRQVRRRAVDRRAAIEATHVPLIARGPEPVTGGTPASTAWAGTSEFGRHGLSWGHAGAFSVGRAHGRHALTRTPTSAIVVLSNAFPTGAPEGIADSFFDLVFDGTVSQDWVAAWDAALRRPLRAGDRGRPGRLRHPARPRRRRPCRTAAYLGTYANAYAGEAVVAAEAAGWC